MYDANMRNYSSHYDRKYGVFFHYWDYVGKKTKRQFRKMCSFHTEVTVDFQVAAMVQCLC